MTEEINFIHATENSFLLAIQDFSLVTDEYLLSHCDVRLDKKW